MLNFPLWKVGLIVAILLWGAVLAIPNLLSDGFLGIAPKEPSDPSDEVAMAAYSQQLQEAEDSWWFLPSGKLNLGLDLQGGVKRNSGFEEREHRKASFPAAYLLEVSPVVEIELERAIVSSSARCVRNLNPSLLPLASSHLEKP